MKSIENIIMTSLKAKQCKFQIVNLENIEANQDFTARQGLDLSNYKANADFMDLLSLIREQGQQDPMHLIKGEGKELICVAGYRRLLALQVLSSEGDVRKVTAYIWPADTATDTIYQIATFTNANRKNPTMLEKASLYLSYQERNPKMLMSDRCKNLSLGKNDGYVIEHFSGFYQQIMELLGDETQRETKADLFALAEEVVTYVSAGLIRQNTYMKLVMLTKQESKLIVDDLKLDMFEVQLNLFHLMVGDQYSFLMKKDIKKKYIDQLVKCSEKELEKVANIDEEKLADEIKDEKIQSESQEDKSSMAQTESETAPKTTPEEDALVASQTESETIAPIDDAQRHLEALFMNLKQMEEKSLRSVILDPICVNEMSFVWNYPPG